MKTTLHFVTAVCALVTFVACKGRTESAKAAQIQQGNQKLEESALVETDLRSHMITLGEPASKTAARDLNWHQFTMTERHKLKEELLHFIALSSDVLSLDARRGIAVVRKDLVINKRDDAMEFERSVENFEKIFGENFEPKQDGTVQPPFVKTTEV